MTVMVSGSLLNELQVLLSKDGQPYTPNEYNSHGEDGSYFIERR